MSDMKHRIFNVAVLLAAGLFWVACSEDETASESRLSVSDFYPAVVMEGIEVTVTGTGMSDKFGLLYAADIALGKGENEILIVKRNGVFDVDYIELSPVPETERCNRHDLPPKQCRKGIGALLYRGGAFRAYAACLSHE